MDVNTVNIRSENEMFQVYNESSFIYDYLCPNNYIIDTFWVSARQITWNYYSEINVEVENRNPDTIILSLPSISQSGTNFNFTNESIYYSPLKGGKKETILIFIIIEFIWFLTIIMKNHKNIILLII